MAALLRQVGRGEIDGDALCRQRETRGDQGRADFFVFRKSMKNGNCRRRARKAGRLGADAGWALAGHKRYAHIAAGTSLRSRRSWRGNTPSPRRRRAAGGGRNRRPPRSFRRRSPARRRCTSRRRGRGRNCQSLDLAQPQLCETPRELLEVSMIHSVAGALKAGDLNISRPLKWLAWFFNSSKTFSPSPRSRRSCSCREARAAAGERRAGDARTRCGNIRFSRPRCRGSGKLWPALSPIANRRIRCLNHHI